MNQSWVFDTNVVVSGLLTTNGFSARLIDAVLAGLLRMAYDDRIEAEYREVLVRPKLRISSIRREAFLDELRNQDRVTAMPWVGVNLPDQDDLPFLETASHATNQILVTGNTKHYPRQCRRTVKIFTPHEAWDEFAKDPYFVR